MASDSDDSLLSKLDAAVPVPLAKFDAFPKLPSSYKARSESRGFFTVFVALVALLLVLNDIGEYIWGWPDTEFSIDKDPASFMNINIDMVVNMHCRHLSVDLRDAIGDRLFLSNTKGLSRDGALFDIGQATALKEHSEALSASQIVAQSRKSRGFFSTLFQKTKSALPTYKHTAHNSACRIHGTLEAKKVTANLHVTTLGHGYRSFEHTKHEDMNLTHVINEFSFGPSFPDIVQPLDYSFERTDAPFVAYQYFIKVIPTTYIAPRSKPLHTYQYSVTHYTRVLEHGAGTPGLFFKYELDPLAITVIQRTTTWLQLLIRCVGVIGGVFTCMGYAIRITTRAVEVATGADSAPGLVAAESTSVNKSGLKSKWGGGSLRSRVVRQGGGWVVEGDGGGSPYYGSNPGSPYAGSPGLGPGSPYVGSSPGSPYAALPSASLGPPPPYGSGMPRTPTTGTGTFGPASPSINTSSPSLAPPSQYARSPGNGFGFPPSSPNPASSPSSPSPYAPSSPGPGPGLGLGLSPGGATGYSHFPPTPNPINGGGFPSSPNPVNGGGFPSGGPPPPRSAGYRAGSFGSNGNGNGAGVKSAKKDD